MDPQLEQVTDSKPLSKAPVVRGARACTVCRAAKMKCVGAEDGQKPCQRCKRANVECKFEKHRRGRKPGSKLSEASKMLRRLEKGLNTAKMKSQSTDASMPAAYQSERHNASDFRYGTHAGENSYSTASSHFSSNELPPLSNIPSYHDGVDFTGSASGARSIDMDDDDDDLDKSEQPLFPAKLISRENQRNSFFRTILNPEDGPSVHELPSQRGSPHTALPRIAPIPVGLNDPITAGIITEKDAHVLFDLIFLRLNPFINLFDPALHTVAYVRSKCPFLFTTLIMAGCKFFRHEDFRACQKLANDFAVRAFAEAWKRVEVVQAFACLTYWKDYDDKRTWTYIGYACRMAVELGLNRYVPLPMNETEFQKLERRNRERTYLVLFVHDRSLSTQTGRHWMLPEDDLVRNANTWHKEGGSSIRPEDVIVAAFVELRRIAAETTDVFNSSKSSCVGSHTDVNYEVVLRNCNAKLTQWADMWQHEMDIAGGEKFHCSFLSFFRLYVRLFLNSFGIQSAMSPGSRQSPSLQALSACYTSALDSLRIVSKDFANMSMLRYGQDSIMVMSAYSSVFLLRLLRNPVTYSQLNESIASDIYDLISQTADAYHEASSPASTSAAYHSRFLRSLVTEERIRRTEKRQDNGMPIDPRLQGQPTSHDSIHGLAPQMYGQQAHSASNSSFSFNSSTHLSSNTHPNNQQSVYSPELPIRNGTTGGGNHAPSAPVNYHTGYLPAAPHHASAEDAHYWRIMFLELGYGSGDLHAQNTDRAGPYAIDGGHAQAHNNQNQQHGPLAYHQMPNYGD
ncbi:hypothetical protein AX17_004397 [Amanita inopinata Kibby_2008]|nr:hypothetical protein AX17_004397 [Amanita inopinata Kibby_2008]